MTLFKVRLTASSDRSTMNLRLVYNAGDFSILYEEEIKNFLVVTIKRYLYNNQVSNACGN